MAGFFGKLPSKGDFVSRDLPRDFVDPIDAWFRAGMQSSKDALGDDWFDFYQIAPVWYFYLGGQVVEEDPWIGVWIPSADRVNRSFPFLMACRMKEGQVASLGDFYSYHDWLVQSSDLMINALNETQEFDELCQAFEDLAPFASKRDSKAASGLDQILDGVNLSSKLEVLIRHFDDRLDRIERLLDGGETAEEEPSTQGYLDADAFEYNLAGSSGLGNMLIGAKQCVWQTEGSDDVEEQLVLTEGLPDTNNFASFLKGFDHFD